MEPKRRNTLRSTLRTALVCLVAMLADAAHAATINVGPGQPYTTIQAGINAANKGDTVMVAPGTYYENIDFKGKAITVTSSGGSASTIIDGSLGQNPTVVFRSSETNASILKGFTIQGGGYETYPTPTGSYGNGGILINQATPTIENNIITHNHCNDIQSNGSSPLIQNNEIDNTLDAKGQCGFAGGSAIWLSGSLSSYNGGTQLTTPPAMVIGNTIQNNTQSGRDDAGGNGGTGVAVWGAYAYIARNIIRNNLTLGDGGAILAFNTNQVVLLGNLIYGNQAHTDGAISLNPPDASVGPFIGILGSNTIYGNTQTASVGGFDSDVPPTEVYLNGNLGQYLLVNNIIVGTGQGAVAVSCGVIYKYLSVTPLVFDHNDIYNPSGTNYGGSCPDQTGVYGNISADPRFSNASTGDYTLQPGSPAIDAGNNSAPQMLSADFAGNPRIQDATGLGYPVIDMGVYESAGRQDAAPTILTLTPSQYDFFGNSNTLYFTINLSSAAGIPTGPVTIYEDTTAITTVLVGASGTATYSGANLTPGLHAFIATYPGTGIFPPAVSVKFYLNVPLYSTTMRLSSTPNPSIVGSSVTFTATDSASDGTIPSPVVLQDTSTNTTLATLTPNAAGVATFSTTTLAVGYHSITATYAGDATHASASASVFQDVINGYATTTTLSCSPNPVSAFGTASFTASASSSNGTPQGSFSFTDNGAPLFQFAGPLSTATYVDNSPSAGTHQIVVTFAPTGNYAGSSASCTEVVNALPTTTMGTITPPNSVYGTPVTLSAVVAPVTPVAGHVPTGTVSFYYALTLNPLAALLGTVPLNAAGVAVLNLATLPGGSGVLTCSYSGDANFAPSNCVAVTDTVAPAATRLTLTSSLNPAPALTAVTFTAHLALSGGGVPPVGSAISLSLNNQAIVLTTDANGNAAYTTSALVAGTYPVTAGFAATSSLQASSAALTEVVTLLPTTTTLTAAPNPAYLGQTVTLTATVAGTPTPTGSVTFFDNGAPLGTVPMNLAGQATFTTSTLAVGTHPLTASYATGSVFAASTSPVVSEVILASGFTIALSPTAVSIPSGQSKTVAIQLASLGNFSGPLTLGPLPQYATGSIAPTQVTLAAGGTGSSVLTLNTLHRAENVVPRRPGSGPLRWPAVLAATALLLWPLGRRRRGRLGLVLGMLLFATMLQTLTGCDTAYYQDQVTAPGTYAVTVTATDINHNSQSATLTVAITQ